MTNFDFLLEDQQFESFSAVAVSAEKILHIDLESAVINCRRAMEFAVKWMYSVDKALVKPYQDNLASLMESEEFRGIVGIDLYRRMDFIRKMGNNVAHTRKRVSSEQAMLCLKNLFIFLDFVVYCYGKNYVEREYDPNLALQQTEKKVDTFSDIDFEKLLAENASLKAQLTARREEQQQTYVPKPIELSEYKTRKLYIDAMLIDAGWVENEDWQNEVAIPGMPNNSEEGFADYVLYGNDFKPLAVIEAKRTSVDISKGRQQAELYAQRLAEQYGRKPVIFLTNGFETKIIDNRYPERRCAAIYSKRDLEKLFNLYATRSSLRSVEVNRDIAGRYYQIAAVKAVCDALDNKNRRKALLVMATGSGKTRTIIGLCDVLLNYGWIKNILFLADRTALVRQAKNAFTVNLPNLSTANLTEEKSNPTAHCIFSTYQTMMNCIDEMKDESGKLFTCGHFDLVICDEAHRSIYNKYKDIFHYFDAPLVGLTATPKDDIDKSTYEVFELESGVPTFGYELAQAVKDGYLVDFISVETSLKFVEQGIAYDELCREDQLSYEATFKDENDEIPERIQSSALNEWVFNEDTIRSVLRVLMDSGLKIDYGQKIGKSIIFAKNHRHAEKIYEVFGKEFPHLVGYAKVIDNYINYAQSAIDEFSDANKLPQIAISVDMLDTGIDIPEVLNLVFFKKVMSKSKFWQMIGRGTRLCPNLIDGADKDKFYIFDFCGNFEFFRIGKEKPAQNPMSLQSAIFVLKTQIIFKLQDLAYQTKELIEFRNQLVDDLIQKVRQLDKSNFAVKQHLRYVERYSIIDNYTSLTFEDTLKIKEEIVPLVLPDQDDPKALRFDALMYGIELAYLAGKSSTRAKSDLIKKVQSIAAFANIPEVMAQSELIDRLLRSDYLERCGIPEFEHIRKSLRDLIKYIEKKSIRYDTNFSDEILSTEWNESDLSNDDLRNYKAKAEYYIRQNQNHLVIAKLKKNIPLTREDVQALELILWNDLGTQKDYEAEYGDKPLGEFVRELIGLDMNAAKEAFSEFLDNTNLDSRQIYFVNQIIEYIVHNGILKDFGVLRESPFTNRGSVVEIFSNHKLLERVLSVIEQINSNAVA